jgi:hypothetical protein
LVFRQFGGRILGHAPRDRNGKQRLDLRVKRGGTWIVVKLRVTQSARRERIRRIVALYGIQNVPGIGGPGSPPAVSSNVIARSIRATVNSNWVEGITMTLSVVPD